MPATVVSKFERPFALILARVGRPTTTTHIENPERTNTMLWEIALSIAEDAEGANGDRSRTKRISRAASGLCDYVHETLIDHSLADGVSVDQEFHPVVQRMIAAAMVAQYEYDEDRCGQLVADVANNMHSS
jgi:hypothetical protein